MSDRKAEMETVTATFTFTGADALSTSSFSIWKVSSEAATMLAGSESSWTEGEQTFTTTEGLNAGERLVLIWNSNNGGKSVTISDFSASYKKAVTATATTANLQSGFYRIKYAGSDEASKGKYLVAPENLPTGDTNGQNWKISLAEAIDPSNMHKDVWYVENLGLADGGNTTNVRYKIWCFRGGYGISTNPAPDVYGSYGNANCPRLYRIMEVTKGEDVTYAWGGHPNDNVEGQSMGLNHSSGAIGNKNYLSNTLVRGEGKSDATDATVQWTFEPVSILDLPITLQFGETGYATFSSCATVKIPSSVTVYEVINTTNGYVQMNELSGTIPANAGVIVKANPNALISFVPTNGPGKGMKAVNTDGSLGDEADKDNKLVAAVNATTIAEGDYILAKNAEGEVVFGIIGAESDKNLAAGKAYLPAAAVPAAGGESNALRILWDDTETGIANITKPATLNGKMIEGNRVVIVKNGLKYTLSGQRIK